MQARNSSKKCSERWEGLKESQPFVTLRKLSTPRRSLPQAVLLVQSERGHGGLPPITSESTKCPGSTYVLYFNGTSGWEILPHRTSRDKTAGGPIDLVDEELQFAKQYLSGLIFKKWLAERQSGYTISSPLSNVVRVTDNTGQRTDMRLDPKTWLPLAESSPSADPAKPPSQEMRIEVWSKVDGIRFPSTRTNYHDGVRLAAITADRIRLNTGLKIESLQARPVDSLPRMSD